jgi:hypothetical protein
LIGERLSETVPDTDAPWEFIDLLFELIEPSVDGALRTFPFLRYLPCYYGDMYRRTVEARDKVAKLFFDYQKVKINLLKRLKKLDIFWGCSLYTKFDKLCSK